MRARSRRGKATREQQAESIKEAIYLTFTAIAVLIAAGSHGDPSPIAALGTLLITATAMCLAILTADVLSHLVVHDTLMSAPDFRHAIRASCGSLTTLALPTAILTLGVGGLLEPVTALRTALATLAVTLVAVGWFALRGIPLGWWQRMVALTAIGTLAVVVVGAQVLAHG